MIRFLCLSNKWNKVIVVARKKLPIWDELEGKEKIQLRQVESLDELEDKNKWKDLQGVNAMFCCLGSRTKYGEVIKDNLN